MIKDTSSSSIFCLFFCISMCVILSRVLLTKTWSNKSTRAFKIWVKNTKVFWMVFKLITTFNLQERMYFGMRWYFYKIRSLVVSLLYNFKFHSLLQKYHSFLSYNTILLVVLLIQKFIVSNSQLAVILLRIQWCVASYMSLVIILVQFVYSPFHFDRNLVSTSLTGCL